MNDLLQRLEQTIHELLDIEIYCASEVVKAEGCTEDDKTMSIAYQLAINRAKKLVSACFKRELQT